MADKRIAAASTESALHAQRARKPDAAASSQEHHNGFAPHVDPANAPTRAAGDEVDLRETEGLRRLARSAASADVEKPDLAAIKEAVQNGTYRVDPEALAHKLLADPEAAGQLLND